MKRKTATVLREVSAPGPLKLDLACGKRKREGFVGVDERAFDGVDVVWDLLRTPWQWADDSVDEVVCSHFLEHLTAMQRVAFMNELHRVLKPGAKATIIVPYWASARAYGDPTHQWPPVTEFAAPYWNAQWRNQEAPHLDMFTCDFDTTCGYVMHPLIQVRNQEYQNHAITFFKEAALELHFALVCRK